MFYNNPQPSSVYFWSFGVHRRTPQPDQYLAMLVYLSTLSGGRDDGRQTHTIGRFIDAVYDGVSLV